MVFTTLAHHVYLEFILEAYRRIRKAGAVGVDGVTASQYEEDLGDNRRSLEERFKLTRPKRLGKYGLSLNQDKTRLVRFYPSTNPRDCSFR
jgi:hypothetical protein